MLKERKRGSQKPEHVGKKLNKETLNFQYWLKQIPTPPFWKSWYEFTSNSRPPKNASTEC